MKAATGLATIAVVGGIVLVMLLFAPALEAPFLVPKTAALQLAASLGLVAFSLAHATTGGPTWTRPMKAAALLVAATTLLAWGAAACRTPGAPYGLPAAARWASLVGVACAASVLSDRDEARDRALFALRVTLGLVAALGLLQHLGLAPVSIPVISLPGSTFGNRNLAAEVIALGLPLSLASAAGTRPSRGRAVAFGLVGLQLLFLAVTRARAAWLGAACGVATTVLLLRPRWSPRALGWVAVVLVASAAAAAVPGRYDPRDAGDRKRYAAVAKVLEEGFDTQGTALRTRLGLWKRTMAMVRDQPWLGVGPGNWPVVFPRYAEPGATRDGVLSPTLAPRQAHDDLLERAAETGLPGALALVLLGAAAAGAARRRLASPSPDARAVAAGASGALVALVAVSIAGFPLEMPGTILLTGLALGLLGAHPTETPPAAPSPRTRAFAWGGVACGVALFVCAGVDAERSVRASAWVARAEQALHHDHGPTGAAQALGALRFALRAQPHDYRALLRVSQMLRREKRAAESAAAGREAVQLEPYAPNGWAALAAAELDLGDARAARQDATTALGLLGDYPFALETDALAAEKLGDRSTEEADRARLSALHKEPDGSNEPTKPATAGPSTAAP